MHQTLFPRASYPIGWEAFVPVPLNFLSWPVPGGMQPVSAILPSKFPAGIVRVRVQDQ